MFVKICGITNEEDALLSVAVGADAIGFVFAPSKRKIPVSKVADIVRRLPNDILTVGVFKDELPERVIKIINETGLMAAQLHDTESPSNVKIVKKEVRTVFKAVTAGSEAFYAAADFQADAILVDSEVPGAGEVFDWQMAENGPPGVPLILAGGLTPENVSEGIRKVKPWGVDVSSGVERSPGVKDPILVRSFIQAAKKSGRDIADLNNNEDLIELYCGVGTFCLPLSDRFKKVFATENNRSSIKCLKKGVTENNINNLELARLSSSEVVELFNGRNFNRMKNNDINSYNFSHVLVDPPRSGLTDDVIKLIKNFDNIIYISCNTETYIRDIRKLNNHSIKNIELFDQFPNTNHLEIVSLLSIN